MPAWRTLRVHSQSHPPHNAWICCWLGGPAAVDHKLELAALSLPPAQMGSKRLTQPQASIVDPNDDITLLKACKDTAAALCHGLD